MPQILHPKVVDQTDDILHVYIDPSAGNDQNDGYSWAKARRTLTAGFAVVPDYVKHNTCIHLRGDFPAEYPYLQKVIPVNATLIVDGGTDLTTVTGGDVGGNPYTATGATTSTVTVAGAGWAVDAFAGYFLQIMSDSPTNPNQNRLIVGNTADTITVARLWAGAPTACTFKMVRPATSVNGTILMTCPGMGRAVIQNLYVPTGAGFQYSGIQHQKELIVSHMVYDTAGAIPIGYGAGNVVASNYRYNGDTFATETADTFSAGGVGVRGSNGAYYAGPGTLAVYASYFSQLHVLRATSLYFTYGSRAKQMVIRSCPLGSVSFSAPPPSVRDSIANYTGYVGTRLGGNAAPGLLITDSTPVQIGAGVDISGCTGATGHGIACERSGLVLNGAVAGSGNAGAGVYASAGSVVYTKSGAAPTITGTLAGGCDLSTDGTTQASTWAAIEAGTPVADLNEFTLAKKMAL